MNLVSRDITENSDKRGTGLKVILKIFVESNERYLINIAQENNII